MLTLISTLWVAHAADWPPLQPERAQAGDGSLDAALIVGIEDYYAVDDIPGARRNAEDWYQYLTEARKVPASNVTLLRDAKASKERIEKFAGEAAAAAGEGGTVWFVFIGHGAPSPDAKDGLLVGADAQADADSLVARSVSRKDLLETLESGPGNPVLVLDACFSGRGSSGALVPGMQPLIPDYATVDNDRSTILTAGASDEFAGPLPGGDRPAFSYLVLGAAQGWGDRDKDGTVTLAEATDYARQTLTTVVKDRDQTPAISGPSGDFGFGGGKQKGPNLTAFVLETGAAAPVPEPKPVKPPEPPKPPPAKKPKGNGMSGNTLLYASVGAIAAGTVIGTVGRVTQDPQITGGDNVADVKQAFRTQVVLGATGYTLIGAGVIGLGAHFAF